ncbi:hypothetical protein O7627_14720 [Solwaraspora sp. WMMD1047]|uniref:hypothetical protein n=1 Tax=Solwaraspora sp. WMMD1047 TaxID=3016102 RepID=UPI0024174F47|nr:hypothetical protein [Solwaraspora sp. WMMD1047]MDG4830546.1 hypothetical protein [Solwaraspora sp. WMMD1047]
MSMPFFRIRFVAALMVAAVLATLGVVTAGGTPASANCTSHVSYNHDNGSDLIVDAGSTGLALRQGPHTSCGLIRRITGWVDLRCWDYGDVINGHNSWSNVRWGNYQGWVSDAYLLNNGSTVYCYEPGLGDIPPDGSLKRAPIAAG